MADIIYYWIGLLTFFFVDGMILRTLQKLSDFLTRKTGKTNFQVALLIAYFSAGQMLMFLLVRYSGKVGEIFVMAIFPSLYFLGSLYVIWRGQRCWVVKDGTVMRRNVLGLGLLRMLFFAFAVVNLLTFKSEQFSLDLEILIITYFASLRRLPGSRVKVLRWMWGKIKASLVSAAPAPTPVPDKV